MSKEKPMTDILIFAGTTEGRCLAEQLSSRGVRCTVSVATSYGASLMTASETLIIREGRLGREGMAVLMEQGHYAAVVDATHPFATLVSDEIRSACEALGLKYLRLSRRTEGAGNSRPGQRGDGLCVTVSSVEEAAFTLAMTEGNIFLTTGSKELAVMSRMIGAPERLYARILPLADSLALAEAAGLKGRQILAAQGPFDVDMNMAMLKASDAAWMVTKETGIQGGFEEKLEAAARLGVKTVIISNPEKGSAEGLTQEEIIGQLETLTGCSLSEAADTGLKTLYLAGIGTGSAAQLTAAVKEAVQKADVVFGAPRILDTLDFVTCPKVPLYMSRDILAYLEAHPGLTTAAAAFSGDSGFFSGAAGLLKAAKEALPGTEITVLPGISALSYFASRLGRSWQNVRIISAHGRRAAVISQVRRSASSYVIVSGAEDVRRIGKALQAAEEAAVLSGVTVSVGYQLSYPEERVFTAGPEALASVTEEGLYVLLIDHAGAALCPSVPGIPDEAFLRDNVPMTKEEVRSLSLCKLQLTAGAVVWDIGAGSGSVSVEAARLCPDGHVYAIEQKGPALDLIEKNRAHFAVDNMTVIAGTAPEALEGLPAPTHAFIGGSDGRMEEVLAHLVRENPSVRVVINTVTLESLEEARRALAALPYELLSIVQVQVSRAESLGRYHLMKAQNPVCILTAAGRKD